MAKASGTDLAGFQSQLDTTKLFATPKEALEFATSKQLPSTMRKVAEFSFEHGLLGEGAKDTSAVGMAFANGVTERRQGQPQAALRPELRADGRRRQAVNPRGQWPCA
jgi:NitT/TauT family transport system substrate-binding protein